MMYDQPLYRRVAPPFIGGYSTRILTGFLGSLTVVLLLFHLPFSSVPKQVGWSSRSAEWISISELRTENEETNRSSSGAKGTSVPPSSAPPQTLLTSAETRNTESDGDGTKKNPGREQDEPNPSVRSVATLSLADEQPQIIGGMSALYLHIHYPLAARRQGIEGRLELHFTVGRNGSVRDIEVAKSLHPLCDSAAVRALRSVQFTPAKHNGEIVPIRMHLPVRFKLRPDSTTLRSRRFPLHDGS